MFTFESLLYSDYFSLIGFLRWVVLRGLFLISAVLLFFIHQLLKTKNFISLKPKERKTRISRLKIQWKTLKLTLR